LTAADAELAYLVAPLAFQVWDGVGWLGQILFTLRMLQQWLASERAGRSVLPHAFWWLSLGGSVALLVYQFHREDPVFLAGVGVNTAIYLRNLVLVHRRPQERPAAASPVVPVVLGLLGVAAIAVVLWQAAGKVVDFDQPTFWLALGFTAQAIWSGRFIVQWYASEKLKRSVLPPSFFWVSIVGAVLLFVYAVYRVDWVMMAAYAFNPIPYARNLVLLHRARQA
jgi:lipid-A-disaccharide synthase-like uncharacterized protein